MGSVAAGREPSGFGAFIRFSPDGLRSFAISCATRSVARITTRSVVQLSLPTEVFRLDDVLGQIAEWNFAVVFDAWVLGNRECGAQNHGTDAGHVQEPTPLICDHGTECNPRNEQHRSEIDALSGTLQLSIFVAFRCPKSC